VPRGRAVAQRIKVTLGIQKRCPFQVAILEEIEFIFPISEVLYQVNCKKFVFHDSLQHFWEFFLEILSGIEGKNETNQSVQRLLLGQNGTIRPKALENFENVSEEILQKRES
jgi:hypothetical protein